MRNKFLALGSIAGLAGVLAVGLAGTLGAGRTRMVAAQAPADHYNYLPVAYSSVNRATGLQIQNLDQAQGATISVDLYKSNGSWDVTLPLPLTAPGAAASLWLPGTSLPAGEVWSAIAHSDRPIASIARTDWSPSGGAAIYSSVIPGKTVALPLAVRNYYGQSSSISIQNTDRTGQARISVDFIASGAPMPAMTKEYAIPAGAAIHMDLNSDSSFEPLGSFVGSVLVTSATDVGVMSFVHNVTSVKAVYGFEGIPAEMASATLYAPLFRAKQYVRPGDPSRGRLDTAIAVMNPGTTEVEVTITYYGAGGSCAGETVTGTPAAIASHSSHVFWQGDPAGQGLKADCYGSAVIQSTGGGVLAIVNDAQNLNQTAAAYNAFSADQASTTVALPLYRKNHANGFSTGISVMNVGSGQAQITVSFSQNNPNSTRTPVSCGAPCTQTVGANQTAIFFTGDMAVIPNNSYGSATVQSTQPVAVIVNDVNIFTGQVDAATYGGIKVDVP